MSPTKPPAQAVSPLGRRSVKTLQARAVKERLRWVHADCSAARSKRDVMATLARAFALPAHFGGNLDALYDCLTDLEPLSGDPPAGFLCVVEGLPAGSGFGAAQIESLLEVFADTADHFRKSGIGFELFYSLSGESPARP